MDGPILTVTLDIRGFYCPYSLVLDPQISENCEGRVARQFSNEIFPPKNLLDQFGVFRLGTSGE